MPLLYFAVWRGDRRTWALLCPAHQQAMRAHGWRLRYARPAHPGEACDCCAGLSPNDYT